MAADHAPRPSSDGNIRQGFPSCRIPTMQPRHHPAHPKASLAFRGVPHASTCALLVRNPCRGIPDDVTGTPNPARFLAQAGVRVTHRGDRFARSANRTHDAGHMELHTHARLENPSDPNSFFQPSFCPSAGSAYIHRVRFRTGFHSHRRARGGLVRRTARTSRSLLCKSGMVLEMATAAIRPLSLV